MLTSTRGALLRSNATARMTVGALFGTVTSADHAVSATINSVTKTVGMLKVLMDNAAAEQQERMILGSQNRTHHLVAEDDMEMTQCEESINKYTSQSKWHSTTSASSTGR